MADDTLDTAAQAFDAAISTERGNMPAAKGKGDGGTRPRDSVFPNLGNLEIDDESPEIAGGDLDEDVVYADEPKKKDSNDPDEDEDDEDAEDGEDEEDGDKEDDESDDEALNKKYSVMVDGEEQDVTLKEALEGYIRTDTFHKRMSEAAETQQVVQRAASEVVSNYEYAKQLIDTMEAQMKELVPPEPDWDKLFAEDPAKARNLQKYYQQVEQFKGKLKMQREEANAAIAKHNSAQLKAFADAESLRFSRLNAKNWGTDPQKKAKDLQSMRRTAIAEGFSEEEVNSVYDSRMLSILLKASKYDRMMAARPKPVNQGSTKPVKPGPGNKRTGRKGVNEAMKRLARTGSIQDAAPVFDQILRNR